MIGSSTTRSITDESIKVDLQDEDGDRFRADTVRSVDQNTRFQAKIAMWETEIRTRKQSFGVDIFDVMQRNRNVGERMGGVSDDPQVVEVFADATTDVEFLVTRRQQKQSDIAKLNIAARDTAMKAMAMNEKATNEELSGTSILLAAAPIAAGRISMLRLWPPFSFSMGYAGMKLSSVFPSKTGYDATRKNLMSEIDTINKEILHRKQLFGIEMFDAMIALGENFLPRDERVCQLFLQAKKDMDDPLKKINDAVTMEQNARDAVQTISLEELREYVQTLPIMWAMLSVKCQIPEQYCKEVAFRVAIELITDQAGQKSMTMILTKQGFRKFEKLYIEDAKGQQEFFHRTVFAAFDEDWNGALNREEIDKFLDNLYISGNIFQGDARLPEKTDLKAQVLGQLDASGDGVFSFDEVRSLISGSVPTSQ